MRIRHHPDISTLMSCAAGSQPEAQAAVVASHLAMCPRCAAEVGRLERIGAALFDSIATTPVERPAPVVTARSLEAEDVPAPARPAATGDVPLPLVDLVGPRLDTLPWKLMAPGVWHLPLKLSEGARGQLHLLKVAPGTALPEHGHGGEELTLVLKGSYRDALGEFGAGDVADLDTNVEHRPIADPEEGCICLIASETKARFKGLVARLMQPLTGM